MKYQTKEYDDLINEMETFNFFPVFTDKIKGLYMTSNIEEMAPIFYSQLDTMTFITEDFKNRIKVAINSVIEYRKHLKLQNVKAK